MSYIDKLKTHGFIRASQVLGPRDDDGLPDYSIEIFRRASGLELDPSTSIVSYSDSSGSFWSYNVRGDSIVRSDNLERVLMHPLVVMNGELV